MYTAESSSRPLIKATTIGTVLQLCMVIGGHFVPAIAAQFAVLGVTLSLVAGYLYAHWARPASKARAAGGGAAAGGLCALLGIAVSVLLGDVPPVILAFGTLSSAVTGAIGGFLGQLMTARTTVHS